ncbi:MAG: MBL fold metallo-hydrolase [Spirochaetes bacterium]|nr:MBL fold metallo-hydrolase [Spirochaetota bacterium]
MKLWGVRGSLPSPTDNREYRNKVRNILQRAVKAGLNKTSEINNFINSLPENLQYYCGGNTTCAVVTSKSGNHYILDCGSGIRPLGDDLLNGPCGKGKGNLKIFITHVHWDHIQGLPFFKPMYIPGNVVEFISPYEALEKNLKDQMEFPFFPAPFHGTASDKKFTLIEEGREIELEEGLYVDCYHLKHPGGSYAYRFRKEGKTLIFATDAEFTGETLEKNGPETDFFMNADLLIIDSQYTLDEHFSKFEWGHTSYTMAVNCGIRWGVKHLVLTHHDPGNDENRLKEIYDDAVRHRNHMKESKPVINMAREGMTFEL